MYRIGEFFAAVGRVLAYPFVKLYEFVVWFFTSEYFIALLPIFVAVVYPILWFTGTFDKLDGRVYMLFDFIHYDWFFVHLGVDWLLSIEHTFFTAITLGLIQILFIAIAAVLETLIVYVLFFGIGSLIFFVLQLVFWLALLLVLPAGCVVYSGALVWRSYAGMRGLHIVVLVLTVISVVIHYIYTFADFSCGIYCG